METITEEFKSEAISAGSIVTEDMAQEIKALQDRLVKCEEALDHAFNEMEKACLLLNHWERAYLYNKKPDPRVAVICGSTIGPKTVHQIQSTQWYFDYKQITGFVCIANGCIHQARESLKEFIS